MLFFIKANVQKLLLTLIIVGKIYYLSAMKRRSNTIMYDILIVAFIKEIKPIINKNSKLIFILLNK